MTPDFVLYCILLLMALVLAILLINKTNVLSKTKEQLVIYKNKDEFNEERIEVYKDIVSADQKIMLELHSKIRSLEKIIEMQEQLISSYREQEEIYNNIITKLSEIVSNYEQLLGIEEPAYIFERPKLTLVKNIPIEDSTSD